MLRLVVEGLSQIAISGSQRFLSETLMRVNKATPPWLFELKETEDFSKVLGLYWNGGLK